MSRRPPILFGALLLFLLTFSAYIPAIRARFIWDDDYYAGNQLLERPDALRLIWTLDAAPWAYYRDVPMVYTTFWLERRLWGARPMGYHVDNVILHMMNAVLVWLLLGRLGMRGAWMAGAVFALHPVHVESVAWIAERKNVLSGLFFLLAFGAYLRFEEGEGRRWYWGSLSLFLLALLSKAVTCALPAALLLVRWQRGLKTGWREARDLIPFFALAFALGLFTVWVETNNLGPDARRAGCDLSLSQHLLLAGRALWFYPMKLAWPIDLSFSYERWALDARDWAQWLWPAAALAGGAWVWLARGLWGRGLAAAIGFYLMTIAPMLGFFRILTFRFTFVADHYQYLASIGWIAAAVGGAARLFGAGLGAALSVVVLLALGAATWRQGGVYRDDATLWEDVLAKNPASFLAHTNLGHALAEQGRLDEAIRHYRLALQARPDAASARNNLGVALAGQGRIEEALRQYELALLAQPDFAEAHSNLGSALARQGRMDEAVRHYGLALQAQPYCASAHNNLALALAGQGRLDDAVRHYDLALQARPDFAEAHSNLGGALARQGRLDDAVRHYELALQARPDFAEAHNNLGAALAKQGRMDEAIRHYGLALKAQPDFALAHENLGLALAGRGLLPARRSPRVKAREKRRARGSRGR
ncbi:MAG: tetratricopeptide repeat protein [Elusimicrobia bacterium]|nr:tetratricopeptide repeat protein [Elusimicrobiota bacterium]